MMKPSKNTIVGAIALAAALVAASCSGSTTTATEGSSDNPATSDPSETTESSDSTDDSLSFTEEEITIGYSAKDVNSSYGKQLAKGIEGKARELNADIVIVSADSDPDKQIADVKAMVEQGVDGVIIEPVDSLAAVEAADIATDAGASVLAITDQIGNSAELGENFVFPGTNGLVTTDDRKIGGTGAEIIKQQLVDKLNVAILAGPQTHERYKLRLDGFVGSLERSTKPFEILDTSYSEDTAAQGAETCTRLLETKASTNIIFAVSDQLALGCIEAFTAAGLDPADLPAIVSVGGSEAAKTMLEQDQLVASICVQPREIGELASSQLMNTMLTGKQARSAEFVASRSVADPDDLACPFNW